MISIEMDYNFQIAVYKSTFFDASTNLLKFRKKTTCRN